MPEPTFELLERIAQELRDEIAEQRARLRRLEDVQDHLARVLEDDGPLTEGLTEVCAPRVEPAPRRKVTEEFARDTLVRLKEVTVGQYADALGLSQTRARAYLKRFERRKMLEVVVRDDARAHLYRYIDPRTAPPGPKVNGSHARTRARAKGSPVPGTGRQRRFRKEAQDRERDRITMAAHCRMAALEAIQAERARQLSEEGWSVEHDDRHSHGEIARAAAAYAAGDSSLWPWEPRGVKLSSDRLRDLAKAGALIVAEMERLMREEMDRGE